MNTKAEERAALEKIKTILSGLDADGYVNTAFKGCVEDAETNIENDWACSMADRYAHDHAELEKSKAEAARCAEVVDYLQSIAITDLEILRDMEEAINDAAPTLINQIHSIENTIFAHLTSGDLEAARKLNIERDMRLKTLDDHEKMIARLREIRATIVRHGLPKGGK